MNKFIEKLVKTIKDNYILDIIKLEKNIESTVGNVYIIYSNKTKFVAKTYDDLTHVKSMVNIHSNLSDEFHIPKIIKSINNTSYVEISSSNYIILYSFLDGVQIGKKFDKFNEETIKNIALELRKLHELTNNKNKYNLNKVPKNEERKPIIHYDLTKGNIFYNKNKIGFIDFDDAKYGPSICDVAIIIALLFFSKKRGIDKKSINTFIDTYYGKDEKLKLKEIKYIKEIAINWINYTLDNNNFKPSTTESFEIKKKLIQDNLFN